MSEVKSKRCLYCHVEKPLNLENFDLNRRNYDFNKVCSECMTNQRANKKEKEEWHKRCIEVTRERIALFENAVELLRQDDDPVFDEKLRCWLGDKLHFCQDCTIESLQKQIDTNKKLLENIQE